MSDSIVHHDIENTDKPVSEVLMSQSKDDEQPLRQTLPPNLGDFLVGLSQLSIIGVIETTAIVEAMHREIALRPFGLFNDKYSQLWRKGISGRIYRLVQGMTALVGKGVELGIHQTSQLLLTQQSPPITGMLKALVDIINGVMGDHLVTKANPLAQPMLFYTSDGIPYGWPNAKRQSTEATEATEATVGAIIITNLPECAVPHRDLKLSGKVIILAHGLCMGYTHWQPFSDAGLGQAILKQQPESTILYLDYNTGQRISTNGHQFAKLLQQLVTANPDITSIDLIGHSMGGLVFRSALYYAGMAQQDWVNKVDKMINLGTPHHGALLERLGDIVQQTLSRLPFAGALAKLGDIRSVGIIDLRHGSIRDEDWQTLDDTRSVLPDQDRHLTPLPQNIDAYFLAGTLSQKRLHSKASQLLGDGLVNIQSALGEHTEAHTLVVPDAHKAIFYGVGHLALPTEPQVIAQVLSWLAQVPKDVVSVEDNT